MLFLFIFKSFLIWVQKSLRNQMAQPSQRGRVATIERVSVPMVLLILTQPGKREREGEEGMGRLAYAGGQHRASLSAAGSQEGGYVVCSHRASLQGL